MRLKTLNYVIVLFSLIIGDAKYLITIKYNIIVVTEHVSAEESEAVCPFPLRPASANIMNPL